MKRHLATPGQLAIWRACEISQDQSAFNLLWTLRFRGPLDPDRLRESLSRVVGRHEALRTAFEETGLLERILPAGPVDCPELIPGTETIEDIARRFGLAPFELTKGPLFRFQLLRKNSCDHLLLCAFHHLVIDGHSWLLFVDELLRELSGVEIPEPVTQYADFCGWQQLQLANGHWNPSRDFWLGVYREGPPPWDLPSDRPRPAIRDNAMGVYASALPPDLAALLRAVAGRTGTSPFRLAFAAFFAFLHRITGQADLMAATTLIGRSDPRFASLIGFFVNTGGIRITIQDSTRFDELAAAVDATISAAVEHQSYPFAQAATDANPKHEPGRYPLTPVAFTKMPASRLRSAAGLEVTDDRIFLGEAGHDVSVYMHDDCGVFRFTWTYRSALFDPSTIERFEGWFREVLRCGLGRPESPVHQLDFVSLQERRRMLRDWNNTARELPEARSVHAMVEAQVERTPDRIALVGEGLQMTYREVNSAANWLALQLRSRGIGPGDFVPTLMRASAGILIAELAIMKSGAAFVPLDPAWPGERVDELLDRLASRVVLTGQAAAAALVGQNRECLLVEPRAGCLDQVENPGVEVGPEDPVFCIFTSGSTGKPKGAVNCHRGIINRFSVMSDLFGPGIGNSALATSPPVFDSSAWQYFWPLTCGGRAVIFPTEQAIDPQSIPGLVARHGITITDFVPAVFHLLVRHLRLHPEALPSFATLRRIMIGGEAMASDPVYEFKAMLPHVAITNSYGPSETSIGVIFHEVPANYTNPVPIGRPISNVRAVILDSRLKLVPAGLAGELCLGGACVGMGYFKDPGSTAQVFVANPFAELGCPTLYRTGDLARFREDGIIEYLGRVDHQVKIRGIRIELGEIETCLLKYPGVRQAAVLVQEDHSGHKSLVAYLVAEQPGKIPDLAGVRSFLGKKIPSYLTPSRFLMLDSLPLTSSGKVDRKAIGGMAGAALQSESPHEAPQNDLERQIVEIWQDLLGRPRVGIHDHFFELGGDSLLAIRFVGRFRECTGLSLEVRSLFDSPTPAALSARFFRASGTNDIPDGGLLEGLLAKQRLLVAAWRGRQASPESFIFTLNDSGSRRGLFWCFQGYQELTQLAASLGPDQPLHGMRSGHLIMEYTEANIDALAGRYATEMLTLQPAGPFVIGGNCQAASIARAMARHLKRVGRSVELLVLMEEGSFLEYDGRVALLFGRESHFNPYQPGADPEAVFRESYPGGFSVHFIAGGHGQYFGEPNIASLGDSLRQLLLSVPGHEAWRVERSSSVRTPFSQPITFTDRRKT